MITMSLKNITILASGLFVCLCTTLAAQSNSNGLIAPAEARRYGLESAWFTRVELDQARGRIAELRYFVSAQNRRTLYEVAYGESWRIFSERDLDRLGEPIGKEGAERAAKQFAEQLHRLEIESEIKTHEVPEITLYVTTDRAMVQAIDAETGRTVWTTTVGQRDFPTEGPGVNEKYVAVLNGTSLYLLTRDTGQIVWVRQVQGVPAASPAVSDNHVVVPTWTGDVELYELEEPRTLPRTFKSNGRSMIQPTVTANSIIWPTDRGMLYVASATRQNVRYRLEAKDTIAAAASYYAPNRLFVASVDGYVYCMLENVDSEAWRFSTGESVSMTPVPTGTSVYVVTDRMNLYSLDQETGAKKWVAPYIKQFIAASKQRIYGLGMTDRIEILDADTGGRIASMDADVLDIFYPNYQTDRILVGTRTGVLQCLREINQPLPLLHVSLAEQQPAAPRPKVEQDGLPETPAKPAPKKPAADLDPFGEPADPFGAPAQDAADPFGTPAQGAADPFGGGGAQDATDPFGGGADPFQ
jgi:hypothetical protein